MREDPMLRGKKICWRESSSSVRMVVSAPEVSIVHAQEKQVLDEERIFELVKKSVNLIGGIRTIGTAGQRILIKPNIAAPFPPPVCTDPRVVKSLVRLCRDEMKAKEVIVGEATSAVTHLYRNQTSRQAFEITGIAKAVEDAGGIWAPLEEYGYVEVDIPDALFVKKAKISKIFEECDVMINVTPMRTIEDNLVTLSVKNSVMGLLDDEHRFKWHRMDLHQKLVDVYRHLRNKCKLAVLDGLLAGDGPMIIGDVFEMNLLVAGRDYVATDAVGCAIMGFDPIKDINHLRLANFYGLGCADPNRVKVVGDISIDEARGIHGPFNRPDNTIDGVVPNVDVIAGGPCDSCKWWAAEFLRYSINEGILPQIAQKYGRMCVIIGVAPPVPEELERIEGLPVIFGECAIQHCTPKWPWQVEAARAPKKRRPKESKRLLIVPGCPPLGGKQFYSRLKDLAVSLDAPLT